MSDTENNGMSRLGSVVRYQQWRNSRPSQRGDEVALDDYVDLGERVDGCERTECWRCGYDRLIYESCPECGASCKPLTKEKQRAEDPDGGRSR